MLTLLTIVDDTPSTPLPSLSEAIRAAVDALGGVCMASTHPPFLVNRPKTAPLPDRKGVDEWASTIVNSVNKAATVAYCGWFSLGDGIRDAKKARAKIGDILVRGKVRSRVVDLGRMGKKRISERVPLDGEERAAALAEHAGLSTWLRELQEERRMRARRAGDLIPEIERAVATGEVDDDDDDDDDDGSSGGRWWHDE